MPAYNEEEGLEFLLNRIERIIAAFNIKSKIIIVDDGSTDHTILVIESYSHKMPIEIIRFEENRGIAEVFRTGLKKVCQEGSDNDICITMDSDNTQNPYIMLDILSKLTDSKDCYDVVVASRFVKGGDMVGTPFIRRMLSTVVSHMLRKVIPIKGIKDYSSFYRGYRVEIIRKGFEIFEENFIKGHGFSSMANMLIKLSKITDRMIEVPLVLRYDLKEGGTGMKIIKTTKGYLGIIIEQLKRGNVEKE